MLACGAVSTLSTRPAWTKSFGHLPHEHRRLTVLGCLGAKHGIHDMAYQPAHRSTMPLVLPGFERRTKITKQIREIARRHELVELVRHQRFRRKMNLVHFTAKNRFHDALLAT